MSAPPPPRDTPVSVTAWLPIDRITVGDRRRKDLGDLDGLAASIKELGVIEPLVVTADNRLLAGQRRLKAAKLAGLAEVPVFVKDTGDDELTERQIEEAENDRRKGFTASEKLAVAEGIRKLIDDKKQVVPDGVRKAQFIAEKAGFDSETQMQRAAAVGRDGAPELKAAVDAGEVSIGAAADLLELPKAEQAKAVKDGKAKEKAAEVRKAKGAAKPKKAPQPVKQGKSDDDDDTEQVDGLGNPVPDGAADAFFDPALRNLIVDVFDHGKALKSLVDRIKGVARKSEAWPFAHFGKAMTAVANALDDIKEAHAHLELGVPYIVCPKCGGDGCAACAQSGHFTRHMADNADQYGG